MAINEGSQKLLDKYYRQTIDALVAAAGERDSMAQAHSKRVADYAVAIAEKMGGMSPEELCQLGYAASLHDIGKVAISGKILNKLGRLSDDEVKIMRQHCLVATRILEKIEGLHEAIPAIKHHHERYDGAGYPDGLKGKDIPLGARIIAIAETFDILTSDVPWRKAMDSDAAVEEILRCAGSQFDPEIVELLPKAVEALPIASN